MKHAPLAAPAIRYPVEPRLVPAVKAARRLHLTFAQFVSLQSSLRRAGFPAPCSVTGHYDLVAIDEWISRRSGSPDAEAPDDRDKLDRRLDALG